MTDTELLDLYNQRQACLRRIGGEHRFLRDMLPEERAHAERNSRGFRTADAAITAELKRRDGPAVLGEVTLHLTRDRLHFVPLETGTIRLVGCGRSKDANKQVTRSMLYEYPRRGRAG